MTSLLLLLAQPADFESQVQDILAKTCEEKNVPGAIAMVVQKDKVWAHVAFGIRKKGAETPIDKNDPLHLGSVTKSITGYQVLKAVRDGKFALDDPLVKFFPDFESTDSAQKITARHLLHHTSGIKESKNGMEFKPDFKAPIIEQRQAIVRGLLASETVTEPGETFRYDNMNYVALGAILESIAGTAWENQTIKGVFKPLGFQKAGFGPTGKPDEDGNPLTPYQHRTFGEAVLPVILDNPPYTGPSATAHMSAPELLKWAQINLQGAQGKFDRFPNGFPKDQAFWNRLHQPGKGVDYGMGWVSGRKSDKGLYGFGHSGSNTMSLCTLFVDAQTETIGIVMMNAAPDNGIADETLTKILTLLLQKTHSAD